MHKIVILNWLKNSFEIAIIIASQMGALFSQEMKNIQT